MALTPRAPFRGERRYTRREVAEMVGCNVSSVRRAEERGELEAFLDDHGVTRYLARDVTKFAAKRTRAARPGDVAALAFRMFREAAPITDVVEELRITPDMARHLHAEWLALRDADPASALPSPTGRRSPSAA